MKTVVLLVCLTVGALAIAPLLLSFEQVSAQMKMNPNMMRNFAMANGSWMMNPNMMGPMMTSSQNITGSIKIMPTMFNYVASD